MGQTLQQLGNGLLLPQTIKYLPPGDADARQDGDTAMKDDEAEPAVPAPLGDGGEALRLGSGYEAGAAIEGRVADGRHRGGDGDGGESGAASKGMSPFVLRVLQYVTR